MTARRTDFDIGLFLLLALLFSGVFWTLIIANGHLAVAGGKYVEGLMWCPALAAFATVALRRLDWTGLGLGRWGPPRYALLAYLLPLAYALIAYGLVWALGLGSFPNVATLEAIAAKFGWTSGHDGLAVVGPGMMTVIYFVFLASIGMISSLAHALGEEIGWRGFLVPRMVGRFGFAAGALLTGVIWTAWHAPILLFADYNAGTSPAYALSCFAVLVISSSVMLTWLRLRSASVWPCAIMHASHNLFIQGFFTPLTEAKGAATAYAIDEFGWAVPAIAALFALGAWLAWRRGKAGAGEEEVMAA